MKFFRIVLRFARRAILCVLLIYWAIFIGHAAVALAVGGPGRVAA